MENLTSVHFKQKTAEGVLSQVGDGFVDFASIAHCLKDRGYSQIPQLSTGRYIDLQNVFDLSA